MCRKSHFVLQLSSPPLHLKSLTYYLYKSKIEQIFCGALQTELLSQTRMPKSAKELTNPREYFSTIVFL